LKHHIDREETQKFIAVFAKWLDSPHGDTQLLGWDVFAAWFAYVAKEKNYNDVNTYVVAQEGNRVADLIVSAATEDQEADLGSGPIKSLVIGAGHCFTCGTKGVLP
jgi:hypothetical protein